MSVRTTGKVSPLRCPTCAAALAADDVNIALMVALCRACDATVELSAPKTKAGPPAELVRLAAPPPGLTVEERAGNLIFTRGWFQLGVQTIFLMLWCLVWDGFLVVWYLASIGSLLSGEPDALIGLLFPLVHVAVGVGMTYYLAATVVNKTTIAVGPTHLTVTHGPLPWRTPEPIPLQAIDQFYLVTMKHKNTRTYSLVARRSDQTSEQILSGLSDDLHARFMERRMEAHLGLEDEAVEGEYTG